MKAKRKRHSAAFKAKVGFEALVGLKTVSQLAREYAVHPTQVTQWRATIRDHMAAAAGWTTGLSKGCGGASSMRTFICRITATGWPPDAGWAGGLTATTRSVRTRRWITRRRRKCTLIPAPMAPSQPNGKRCSPKDHDRPERLEIRPPAAVRLGTLRKGRGRTGRVTHGSFSLFQRVLKRRMNDRQTKIQMTADRQSPSYFLRSVV